MGVPATIIERSTKNISSPALVEEAPLSRHAAATEPRGRLLMVSNRLPFTAVNSGGSRLTLQPSSGGLVTALERVHARSNSFWIGSIGCGDVTREANRELMRSLAAARLATVRLSQIESDGFYRRYSNEILWPSLHGLSCPSSSENCGWESYRAANERFADAVVDAWQSGDVVWVHDYQLLLLPSMLRDRLPSARIGFFLHTPFPESSAWSSVIEWPQLMSGLLGADVIGFQTRRDAKHFVDVVAGDVEKEGDGFTLRCGGSRSTRVVTCPIGVDSTWFSARSRHLALLDHHARNAARCAGPLFVGVDRLDYTKGIAERLLAFERLLALKPALRGHARFIQVAVPSREAVGGYRETREQIENVVARINGECATAQWTPVTYLYGSVDDDTLLALYSAADVMVVTPKRDGMNLVAKEFVATRTDGGGVLILSRGAGAAEQLHDAVLIDSSDVDSVFDGYQRALAMTATERRSRMRRLRASVASHDVFAWAERFVETLTRQCSR